MNGQTDAYNQILALHNKLKEKGYTGDNLIVMTVSAYTNAAIDEYLKLTNDIKGTPSVVSNN